jgi:hypothetical protein
MLSETAWKTRKMFGRVPLNPSEMALPKYFLLSTLFILGNDFVIRCVQLLRGLDRFTS